MSSWPHTCRRGEETAGVAALLSLEEAFIPFSCGCDRGDPFAFMLFTLDVLVLEAVEGPAAGSAGDWRLAGVFYEMKSPHPGQRVFSSNRSSPSRV
jgi:hypothetical protein